MSTINIIAYDLIQTMAQTTLMSNFIKGFELGNNQLRIIKNIGNEDVSDINDIIKITESGFDINMNMMIPEKQYTFTFLDSKYSIYKNQSDELVLSEIE